MKLLIQSAMIFFGTLMAAAFVALGEPGSAVVVMNDPAAAASSVPALFAQHAAPPRQR